MNEQLLLFLAIIVAFVLYKKLTAKRIQSILSDLNTEQIQLVDVRSEGEFAQFSAPGSMNIPVHTLTSGHTDRLDKTKTIIVYCASGMRSAGAALWLKKQGYVVINAGTVKNVIQSIKT